MKKFLIAIAAGLLIFGGQPNVEAADLENLDVQGVETQDVGKWAYFRDKYILGRETENERRDRKERERRHHRDYYDHHRHHDRYGHGHHGHHGHHGQRRY